MTQLFSRTTFTLIVVKFYYFQNKSVETRPIFSFERFNGLIGYQCTYATYDWPLIINNHYTRGPFCQGLTPLSAGVCLTVSPIGSRTPS